MSFSRRDVLELVGAGLLAPPSLLSSLRTEAQESGGSGDDMNYKIRTITAGVSLAGPEDFDSLNTAVEFLSMARERYRAAGHDVQTIRIATQPVAEYLPDWMNQAAIDVLQGLDQFALDNGVGFSIGQVITDDRYDDGFAGWVASLINQTRRLSLTTLAASADGGIHDQTIRATAEAISAIANETPGGEGNFRFAATAYCPPGTPFFPAAWHEGPNEFALGLQTPNLLRDVFRVSSGFGDARQKLMEQLNSVVRPMQVLAEELESESGWAYTGIDTSPAPGKTASIGEAIETLTGNPFGGANTLSACATITDVLKNVDVKTCGYSGLMLPVMEDPVLAQRALEGHFTVSELLLYSSVCGTGLDTVPLAGDVSIDSLYAVIRDMAALASKYQKALSARLFPVPGAAVGELVEFESPMLTDSVIMALD